MRNLMTSRMPGQKRNLVTQIKGPGMNRGLKKRHKMAQPKSFAGAQDEVSMGTDTGSYLPSQAMKKGGKVQAMQYGKGGKVISCQNY